MTLDEDAEPSAPEVLRELLERLVVAFALDAEIVINEGDGVLRGTIEGKDVEPLVGVGGSVLDAIQHLAQRIVLRGGEGLRVLVDAGGYRERRGQSSAPRPTGPRTRRWRNAGRSRSHRCPPPSAVTSMSTSANAATSRRTAKGTSLAAT